MRIVIAPDSFKECASALEVAQCLRDGWLRIDPGAQVVLVPMADGGEGTVDAMISATGGRLVSKQVTGPMGEPVEAQYGILGDGRTAVIEMASASGLALVPPARRDPRFATTYGTGELIRDALDRGLVRILLGIGGSATNDAGAGMAQALGYSLLDGNARELPRGGAALARLARIDSSLRLSSLDKAEVLVACDVTNPLCGPQGASRIYGPQKGGALDVVDELDAALARFAAVVDAQLGVQVADLPGAGAAGGLGAGLVAFAGAKLVRGVDLVAEACGLADQISRCDLVITGEGCLDGQTAKGKTPAGVAWIAKKAGVPVIAVGGMLGADHRKLHEIGIDVTIPISPGPITRAESVANAKELLRETGERIARMWTIFTKPEI